MLQTVLLVLLIIDSFVLVAAVLLQAGKGTGMAASFGGVSSSPDAFIGTRQAGYALTKISWWAGGLFLGIAFVLQIASAHPRVPKSVLDQSVAPPPASTAPAPSSSAPALPFQNSSAPAPATPAPTTPAAPATKSPAGTKAAQTTSPPATK